MTHSGRNRFDDDRDAGAGEDDATRIVFSQTPGEQATRILTERNDPPGSVIGAAKIQQGVRVAGQPAGTSPAVTAKLETAPTPPKGGASGQDNTQFLPAQPTKTPTGANFDPVVGWLVVKNGPGKGLNCGVHYGQNSIGRDPSQRISLDFGDGRISRDAHAFIVYDETERRFYIRDNGKTNLVRHKGVVVMSPTELHDRDEITIGDTTLLFVALCNQTFDWLAANEQAST